MSRKQYLLMLFFALIACLIGAALLNKFFVDKKGKGTPSSRSIGLSNGMARQSFPYDLLPDYVWALESIEIDEEIVHVSKDLIEVTGRQVWMRWYRVKDFADSDETSRHYAIDRESGYIRFGDGIHGMIPPAGSGIVATYRVGGGAEGNIPELHAGDLVVLKALGKPFSGEYIVKETTHTISSVGYTTRLVVKRSHVEKAKDNDTRR